MKASFTQYVIPIILPVTIVLTNAFNRYGAGDSFGSGNCNSASAACGWYSNPGFNAAASQSLFGVGPGQGAGPICGQCFQLNPEGEGTKSIVVKVNNLCPADGNPLCSADKSKQLSLAFLSHGWARRLEYIGEMELANAMNS